jgi:hypothetical protein
LTAAGSRRRLRQLPRVLERRSSCRTARGTGFLALALSLALCLVLGVPSAAWGQEEPPPPPAPTPSDPVLAAAWSQVEAARQRFTAADRKYQDAQNAARSTPTSEAKAAAKAAKRERDSAQKAVKNAESTWQKEVARYQKRRPPGAAPPEEVIPADRRVQPGAKVPGATPTGIPVGNDVLLPTPVLERTPVRPTATPVAAATLATSPFEGTYSGTWVNRTFGSGGSASAVLTVDTAARTFQAVLTLGGQVFGVGAPPPQTFTGSYDAAGRTINTRSELLGNVSVTISPAGAISGSATGLANPNIARVNFSGTATPQSIIVNYTVVFAGGGQTAEGVMTLSR